MSHGGLNRARSWKRRIQPKKAYSSSGLLYSDVGIIRSPLRATVLPDYREVGISSGNQALTRCAFVGTNSTEQPIPSGSPVTQPTETDLRGH
jgi:hypothetical protein